MVFLILSSFLLILALIKSYIVIIDFHNFFILFLWAFSFKLLFNFEFKVLIPEVSVTFEIRYDYLCVCFGAIIRCPYEIAVFRFAFLQIFTTDDLPLVPLLCQNFFSHFFLLPNTFIYESILLKTYMKANIMNMQIFNLNKYDLKSH